MMYGIITTVPAPVEMYDEIHRRIGASVDGLLVHIGRTTADGFQVLEVWGQRSTMTAPTPKSSFP